jgi:flagellar biosynthesis protein FliR
MQTIAQVLPSFLLIFCRITAFLVVSPIFSFRNIPNTFKVGLAVFLSILVYTVVAPGQGYALNAPYVLLIMKELMIGLLLGFTAYLFFIVVQVAGAFLDMQIGFGIVNVIDPMTGSQSPVLGNFKFFIAMLVFLGLNGHHYLLLALMNSYDWVPIDSALFTRIHEGAVSSFLIDGFARMFYLAFQMAAPLVVALFLVDVALGILARTVPQFNVFVVGLPIKITVGFLVLLVIVPGLFALFRKLFIEMFDAMARLLGLMG